MGIRFGVPSEELETRIGKFLVYDGIINASPVIMMLILFGSIFIGIAIARLFNVSAQYSGWVVFPVLFFACVCFVVLINVANRKKTEYYIRSDEWAGYYAYFICTSLKEYITTDAEGMKKGYRKKALTAAKEFLLRVNNSWTIGNFSPLKDFVRDSVSDFKKDLQYRVIPAIRDGDDELLAKVTSVLSSFIASSPTTPSFSIEAIERINKRLEELPNRGPLTMGYLARGRNFLTIHTMWRHFVMLTLIGLSSFALGYAFWTRGVSLDNAWLGGIGIFGILVGGYLASQRKS
jgi:hypothetical protein